MLCGIKRVYKCSLGAKKVGVAAPYAHMLRLEKKGSLMMLIRLGNFQSLLLFT